MSNLPLEGIRVCDLTWIIAGPTATRILADFGAEVIRVEHGQAVDAIRFGRPIVGDRPTLNNSGFFNYVITRGGSGLPPIASDNGLELVKLPIAGCTPDPRYTWRLP